MTRYALFLLCWLVVAVFGTTGFATAQVSVLEGIALDATTGKPVAFAVVEVLRYKAGNQADMQGAFILTLPQTLAPTDSVTVSALGYVKCRVAAPVSPCRLLLQPQIIVLNEVVVHPIGTRQLLGPIARKSQSSWGCTGKAAERGGAEVARFFSTSSQATILQVAYFISARRECKGQPLFRAPFRVRLYAADGPNGTPGTDLLTTPVLTAASRPGWHTVSLDSFSINCPSAGFYVAMEWLYTNARFACSHEGTAQASGERQTYTSYGQSLGCLREKKLNCWVYSPGYGWQQHSWQTTASNSFINPMIQARIQQ